MIQTTSELVLVTARKCLILAATALPIQGTSSASSADVALEREISVRDQTNSGSRGATKVPSGSAIMEVRRLSGLTWEQLSIVFGVARRSLHFWASGKPLNAPNEERVARILGCIRMIAGNSARETRAMLLEPQPDGIIPLDLLNRGEYEQVAARLGYGNESLMKVHSQLSEEARLMRRPLPPEALIGALHDEIDVKRPVKARGARAGRAKRRR